MNKINGFFEMNEKGQMNINFLKGFKKPFIKF